MASHGIRDKVAIVGMGCTAFGEHWDKSTDDMLIESSSAALQSAGITLVKGDLGGIVRARNLARATMANIRQNLFLAFVYNALGVPVAAGVLYPVLGTLLSPMLAAAAMSLSSVSVIGNALRLRTIRL